MKKILVIEDEKLILELIQRKLLKEGFEVLTAKDGEEGINLIKKEKPDLVLLDIVMPRKDGIEVLKEVSQNEELKKIPVIIISNSGQPVELEQIKKLGAVEWLIKTNFDPQEVVEKVQKILNN